MVQVPTRDELLSNYENVDRAALVQPVPDSHLRSLRDEMESWRQFLPELGMEEREIILINLQEPKEEMKRHLALRKWKKNFGKTATYLSFLNACMKTRETALAKKMLELLNEHMKGTVLSDQ